MGVNDRSFSIEKISKLLFRFAVPAIFSSLVAELYNMVSTVFVGRYVGADAIGAITIAFPIQRLLTAMGLLIAAGASTYAARVIGERNYGELKKIILNSFILTLISLILVSTVIFIFRNPILHLLGASNATYPLANKYVSIILIGGVFQGLAAVMCYIMLAFGQTKMTLYTNLIGVIINIIINYILVTEMSVGIEGSAIATIVSQVIAFGFAYFKFIKNNRKLKVKLLDNFGLSSIHGDILTGIIVGGFSTFVIEISDAVVSAVLNNVLYAHGGDNAIIIVGIITKVSMFLFITMIGIACGMQPIVGYNFGAGNYKRVKQTLKFSLKAVAIVSTVFWAVFMCFSDAIIGFFLKDATLLKQTVSGFKICVSMLPILGIYYVTIYYYQAIGEAKKSFLLSIYREIVIFIPLAILLIRIFGMKGVFIAYPITDVIVILTSIYFIRNAFKEEFEPEADEKLLKHMARKNA